MNVLSAANAARLAQDRQARRAALIEHITQTMKAWVKEAEGLEPFDCGLFLDQVKAIANQLQRDADSLYKSRKGSVSPAMRYRVFRRDGFACVGCGWKPADEQAALRLPQDPKIQHLTIDHIVRHCDGGASVLENLRTLCVVCHRTRNRVGNPLE